MGFSKIKLSDGTHIYSFFVLIGSYGFSLDFRWPIGINIGVMVSMFPFNISILLSIISFQIGYMDVLKDEV